MATFDPNSYLQAKAVADRIAEEVTITIEAAERRIADLTVFVGNLDNLATPAPVGWLGWVQYVDAQAAANPADEAWQDLKRQRDKIVADFNAERSRLQSIVDAINAV